MLPLRIISVLASLGSVQSSPWSGWALVTPVLGDLSPACAAASQSYVENLNGAFQVRLVHSHWPRSASQLSYAIKKQLKEPGGP